MESMDTETDKAKREDMIDWKTQLVENQTATKHIEIVQRINQLINKYGPTNVYIGKTCNPLGRMTGDYNISESTEEELPENFEAAPHDVPHLENEYGKMFIIYETSELKEILKLEKDLIREFENRTRNGAKGGEGGTGSPPWYIYLVVQESAL